MAVDTSEAVKLASWRDVAGRLWRNAAVRKLAFAMVALEVVMTVVVPSVQGTYELWKIHGEAEGAAIRFSSEADIALAKLTNEIEVARNASERFRSEAEVLRYEAKIKREKARIETQKALQAARLNAETASKLEADNDNRMAALNGMMPTHFTGCRGRDAFEKIASAVAGRC